MERVRILEKRYIFDDIFKIEEAVIEHRRHDGSWSGPARQLSFERGDSVAALLLNRATGRLVLVNQFRYPTLAKGPGWLTEIVAGGLDADETPESAIAREVREETGHEVHELEPIATFFASPGGCSERVFLYYGEIDGAERTAAPKGRLGVGDEDIQVVERTAAELWDDLRAGRLQDAKTIIALLWLKTQGLP